MFKVGSTRLRANLDVYNVLNNNIGLNYPTAFNPANPVAWERPGVILPARSGKVSVQVDF
jgi:hypothetical protein